MSSEILTAKIVELDKKRAEIAHCTYIDKIIVMASAGQFAINIRMLNMTKDIPSEDSLRDVTVAFMPFILMMGACLVTVINFSREIRYEDKIDHRRKLYKNAFHPHRPLLRRTMR